MAAPVLEVEGLSRRFGDRLAVRALSLRLQARETVGLCGVNGAGKTTTLRLLAGYLYPDAGRILIDGLELSRQPAAARARVGYLADGAPFPADVSVEGGLRYRARLKGLRHLEAVRAVDALIERCGLGAERHTLGGHLSRGYRQRVGVADALLGEPSLLLLDEPTSGLDPLQVRELRALLGELAGSRAILLSSHALQEVEALCPRVLVLHEGALVADATPAELRRLGARGQALVTVRGALETAMGVLRAAPGVRSVEVLATEPTGTRLCARGDCDGAELCVVVARTLVEAGVEVVELHAESPPLEEALVALTRGPSGT